MSKNFSNGLTYDEGIEVLNDEYSGNVHATLDEDEINDKIAAMRVYTAQQLVEEKLEQIEDQSANEIIGLLNIDYIGSAVEIVQSYTDSGIHVYTLNDNKIVFDD